jgi:hypothetical protein
MLALSLGLRASDSLSSASVTRIRKAELDELPGALSNEYNCSPEWSLLLKKTLNALARGNASIAG